MYAYTSTVMVLVRALVLMVEVSCATLFTEMYRRRCTGKAVVILERQINSYRITGMLDLGQKHMLSAFYIPKRQLDSQFQVTCSFSENSNMFIFCSCVLKIF
jgi:hypothetical protein